MGHGMLMSVAKPRELETRKTSGFYEFGLRNPDNGERAVAYVATPGTLDSAPAEIRALPSAKVVSAAERKGYTIVIYGPGVVVSIPHDKRQVASKRPRRSKKHVTAPAARAAQVATPCGSDWFCLYDFDDFLGAIGRWNDTGLWQNLSRWGWNNRAESMINNRSGTSLLAPGDNGGGSRYCARRNSSDSDFSNNDSISNAGSSIWNSTSPNYHPTWSCFNPF
jgi:peptidase inhibitor family I36